MLPDPDAPLVSILQASFSYLFCGVYRGKRRGFPPDPWVLYCSSGFDSLSLGIGQWPNSADWSSISQISSSLVHHLTGGWSWWRVYRFCGDWGRLGQGQFRLSYTGSHGLKSYHFPSYGHGAEFRLASWLMRSRAGQIFDVVTRRRRRHIGAVLIVVPAGSVGILWAGPPVGNVFRWLLTSTPPMHGLQGVGRAYGMCDGSCAGNSYIRGFSRHQCMLHDSRSRSWRLCGS